MEGVLGTTIVLVIVLILVGLAIASMIRDKKNGRSLSCGADCSRCGGACHAGGGQECPHMRNAAKRNPDIKRVMMNR